MKKSILIIVLVFTALSCSKNERIYSNDPSIKHAKENTFIYTPKKGLIIPDDAKVKVFYEVSYEVFKNRFSNKSIPLIKNGPDYEFTLKIPDSIDATILTITDKKGNSIDTNLDKGYALYLNEDLDQAQLSVNKISGIANYFLKIKTVPEETVTSYEELFQKNPDLKSDKYYLSYLILKYGIDKENTTPEIIDFAEKLIKKADERSLSNAHKIYSILREKEKSIDIKKLIFENYPKGQVAKNDFLSNFDKTKDKSEDYVLNEFKKYTETFDDHSDKSKDQFYRTLLDMALKKEDTANLTKYEELISDKLMISNMYNSHALELSGQDLVHPGTNLDFAEMLSKKAMDIVKTRMDNPKENDDLDNLQGKYNNFSDTYALIIFKQGKYDLAFQYQHPIALQDELDTGGKERYACYAEKVKGPEFAKEFLEKEIADGIDSKVMLNQLQSIYTNLKLPISEFEKIKTKSLKIIADKRKEELNKKYGTTDAFDFALTNLEGKEVKLSDYRGKVVVLDFWATWCAPCIASFPNMQNLVNEYKNSDVEFFFIDTWEHDKPEAIKTKVEKFIKDNNYTFNVLFDYKHDIVAKYKVESIPTKIVIDKNGEMISINSSEENLKALINENIL